MGTTPAPTLLPYPEQPDQPDFPGDMQALAEAIELAVDALFPTGSIIAFGAANPPAGWARCDGSPHGSAALQTLLRSPNAPDLRDRFLLGATGGAGKAVTNVGGTAPGQITLTAGHVPAHNHGYGSGGAQNNSHTHVVAAAAGGLAGDAMTHNHGFAGGGNPLAHPAPGQTPSKNRRMQTGGSRFHRPTTVVPPVTGGASPPTHAHTVGFNATTTGGMTANHTHVANTDAQGGGQGHGANPAFYAVTFIIKK